MSLRGLDFDYLRKLVREEAAIVLEPEKDYLAESRLSALADAEGFASVAELVAHLRAEPLDGLHRRVVEAMATNETSFFRDRRPFEAVRTIVLPALIAERAGDRRLAIWCAGCSTGQEPYSVAMLLREHFTELSGWQVTLVATDLSRHVLERARAGRYTALEVSRGLPASFLARYFTQRGAEWQIADDVRSLVEFREMNLAATWHLRGDFDLVFMRNVLIYFDPDTRRGILDRVVRLMRPRAWLLLGTAEATNPVHGGFERVQVGDATLYRARAR